MDDGELTQYLKCDIELNVAGPTGSVVQGWTAKALRSLADRLEADEFGDGFHDVKDGAGKKIGTIYLDFSEGEMS